MQTKRQFMIRIWTFALVICTSSTVLAQQNPDELPFLIEALSHRDPAIRNGAAAQLERRGEPAVLTLLHQMLKQPEMEAVTAAIVLNRCTRDKLVRENARLKTILLAALRHQEFEEWRWYLVAHLLAKYDPATRLEALSSIIDALKQPQPMKQYAAFKLLNGMGAEAKDAVPPLLTMLEQRKTAFRGITLDEQYLVQKNGVLEPIESEFSTDVESLFIAPNDDTLVTAWENLWIIDTLRCIGALPEQLIPRLTALASNSNVEIRFAACKQLFQCGDGGRSAVVAALRKLLADINKNEIQLPLELEFSPGLVPPSYARAAALRALPYKDLLADTEIMNLCRDLGPAAKELIPDVVTLLSHKDSTVRRKATDLLASFGADSVTAVPALSQLLFDGDFAVRGSAADALGAIGPAAKEAIPHLERAIRFEDLTRAHEFQGIRGQALNEEELLKELEMKQDEEELLSVLELSQIEFSMRGSGTLESMKGALSKIKR